MCLGLTVSWWTTWWTRGRPSGWPWRCCSSRGPGGRAPWPPLAPRKVYVLATHGIFSASCSLILQEASNLEKVGGAGWSALVQIVVTNSLPQAANIALMGDRLEVIDISGQATHLFKLYQTLTFIYRVLF